MLLTVERYADYDRFAWIYNQYWGSDFSQRALPIIETLMLSHLPAGARLLDLCCGTGQLAQALGARGYQLTGLDGSEAMLRFARKNAPQAEFVLGDARAFDLPGKYHAVLSTYDSLNHVLGLAELTAVFGNVSGLLLGGGLFLFDLNMEEGYRSRWRGSFGIVAPEHVCVVRSSYQPDDRLGQTAITLFFLEDDRWQRSDLTLTQRCYSEAEVCSALEAVGFTGIRTYDAQRDLDLAGEVGRTFFLAQHGEA